MDKIKKAVELLSVDLKVEENVLRQLFFPFSDELKDAISQIRDCSGPDCKNKLHNIKGVAANLRFEDLSIEIDRIYKSYDADEKKRKELLDILTDFNDSLNEYLGDLDDN